MEDLKEIIAVSDKKCSVVELLKELSEYQYDLWNVFID